MGQLGGTDWRDGLEGRIGGMDWRDGLEGWTKEMDCRDGQRIGQGDGQIEGWRDVVLLYLFYFREKQKFSYFRRKSIFAKISRKFIFVPTLVRSTSKCVCYSVLDLLYIYYIYLCVSPKKLLCIKHVKSHSTAPIGIEIKLNRIIPSKILIQSCFIHDEPEDLLRM